MKSALVRMGWIAAAWLVAHSVAWAGVPSILRAEPAPEWEAKFAGKKGWIGGDGVYSAVLGPRCILWLFGDTMLGTVKDGRREGAVMVNNTLAVQSGRGADAAIRFISGTTREGKPAVVFTPAEREGWFWPQAAIRVGQRLYLFLPQLVRTKSGGAFGFRHTGQYLAVVDNPDDEAEKWRVKQHRMPFAEFTPDRARSWGSAMLADGDRVYVYGYDERGEGIGRRRLLVARVHGSELEDFRAWRFRTEKGWSKQPEEAAALADGLATEFSVSPSPCGRGYVLVYTENGLGARIVARFADAPEGPWSAPVLLYKCPEMAKDKGVFCYAAKAHPWATAGDELLVSYCVNAWEFVRLFRDEKVYRPKFVRVILRPAK